MKNILTLILSLLLILFSTPLVVNAQTGVTYWTKKSSVYRVVSTSTTCIVRSVNGWALRIPYASCAVVMRSPKNWAICKDYRGLIIDKGLVASEVTRTYLCKR